MPRGSPTFHPLLKLNASQKRQMAGCGNEAVSENQIAGGACNTRGRFACPEPFGACLVLVAAAWAPAVSCMALREQKTAVSAPPASAPAAHSANAPQAARPIVGASLRHAATAHHHSGDLPRRRGALVQQRTAGPRAHPRMSGSAGGEFVTRTLSRGRPRQHHQAKAGSTRLRSGRTHRLFCRHELTV